VKLDGVDTTVTKLNRGRLLRFTLSGATAGDAPITSLKVTSVRCTLLYVAGRVLGRPALPSVTVPCHV
jgi:hypothetical protein